MPVTYYYMTQDSHLPQRIGVFYDGNYFLHVSNYYAYFHPRKSRLSIWGLHQFVRREVAKRMNSTLNLCQIVDAHYFRGRLSASEAANQGNALYYDRVFDDILSSQGVTTHYLPVKTNQAGQRHEKGIDVWLALEAFELAFYKKFDVLVLIAADGDYVPLVRKLNTLGTRVMVMQWDFEYTNDNGKLMTTRTSQDLLDESAYPLAMHEVIGKTANGGPSAIESLFVVRHGAKVFTKLALGQRQREQKELVEQIGESQENGTWKVSTIKALKEGFGFIVGKPKDVFFFHANLVDYDFNDLEVGDTVEFLEETLDDGRLIAREITVIEGE